MMVLFAILRPPPRILNSIKLPGPLRPLIRNRHLLMLYLYFVPFGFRDSIQPPLCFISSVP